MFSWQGFIWQGQSVFKSITQRQSKSEAGGGPDGQAWAISGPHMVRDGPDWTPSIHFLLGINVDLVKLALKSISEAVGAPDGQVWAISGPNMVWDEMTKKIKIKFRYHLKNKNLL